MQLERQIESPRSSLRTPDRAKRIAKVAFAFVAVGFFIFLGIGHVDHVPDNAIVFIDNATRTYFSPPLLEREERKFLVAMPFKTSRDCGHKPATTEIKLWAEELTDDSHVLVDMSAQVFFVLPQDGYTVLDPVRRLDIRGKDLHPDREHRNAGGFIDEYGGIACCMKLMGLRKSRWSEDGRWNW